MGNVSGETIKKYIESQG
ncbi:MAG: hypothetical protein FWH24_02975 [Oscillospiraceae bacterium]|nr:hypothetical protein [Oscillospiraceae bacterium]